MNLWKDFLDQQEKLLGKENTDRWLRSLKVLRFDARNLYLEATDTFHLHWFEQHVRKQAKNLKNGNGRPVQVHVSTGKRKEKKYAKKPRAEFSFSEDTLLPTKQFSSFYVSEENRITYNVFKNWVCSFNYNPMFLYAPYGCGKTHLLMSVAHALQASCVKTIYMRAETFTSHVVRAIQFGKMLEFRSKCRSPDVLILDDVHKLGGGKFATQEEFFHTFNSLHTCGKKVILSSLLPPQELVDIEPRLISRFEWGICLGLQEPSKEDKKKILEKKAEECQFPLREKQANFLLRSFTSLQSLYTAFDALVLRSPTKQPLEEVLKDLLEKEKEKRITSDTILQKTAEILEIAQEDLQGKSQQTQACLARNIAVYLMRKKLQLPFTHIGKIFQRDHSTIMSAVKKVEKNPPEILNRIENSL